MGKKTKNLDQFFTKPTEAKRLYDICKEKLDLDSYDIFLEPSVGANSFGCLFPAQKAVLMDIEPQKKVFKYDVKLNSFSTVDRTKKASKFNIIQMDFLSLGASINGLMLFSQKKIIAIGNPPFGKNCSLALRFFNICATFCETICFIVPRTFKRISIQNQLDLSFHLDFNEDLPYSTSDCVFEPPMGAKCCFQIWNKKGHKRNKITLVKEHPDWEFLAMGPKEIRKGCEHPQPTPPKNADFAMKAYGSNCGEIVTKDLHELRPKSWHWIKCKNPKQMISRFKSLDYSLAKDTVRQESIGRGEVVKLYIDKFGPINNHKENK